MSLFFSISHVVFASTPILVKVIMFLEMDGPLGVEIEPTYGLESLGKFPNSKRASLESKASCICSFKSNVLVQSTISILINNVKNLVLK